MYTGELLHGDRNMLEKRIGERFRVPSEFIEYKDTNILERFSI
jgi:hypothetical protein